ncbi:unnamed protein product [Closterium sp. Naga37s-1]|nr:unnamed protein product [Closterium sp. Naga37s-1]
MCAHQLRGVVIAAVGVANEAFLLSAPISASPANDGSETISKLALRSLLRFPISFHACLCVFWLLPVMDGHFRWRASASPPHLSRDDGDSDDPDDTAAPCRKGSLPAPPLPRAPSSSVTPAAASGPGRRAAVQRELERMARLRAVLDAREAEVLAVLDSAFTWLRCSAQPCVPDAAQAADECAGSWYDGRRQAGLATVVLADDDDDGAAAVAAADDCSAPPAAALLARRSFTSPICDGRRNGARPANGGGQLHSAVRPVAPYSLAGGDEGSLPAQASQAAAVVAGCAPSAGTHAVGGGVVVRAEEPGEGGEVVVKRKRGRPKGSGKKGSLAALTPTHAPPLIRITPAARPPSPASTPRAPATPSASPADAEKARVGSGEMEAAAWGERGEVGRDKVKDGPAVVQFKDNEAAEWRRAGRAGDGSSEQRCEGETEAWRMSACSARRAIEPAGGGGPGRPAAARAGMHGSAQRTGGDEGPLGGGAGMGASGRGRKSKGPTGRPRGRPRVVGVEKKGCVDGPRQWQERAQEGQAGKRVGGEGEKAESSMAEDDSVWPMGDGGGRADEGAGGRAEGGPVYLSDPEQRHGRMLAGDLAAVAGGGTGASSAPPTPSAALGACCVAMGTGTGTGVDDAAEALEAVWGDASGSHGAAAMGSADGLPLDDMQACTPWLHGVDGLAGAHCMQRGAVAVAGKRVEERGQDGGGRVAKMRGSHVGEGSGDGGNEGVMGRAMAPTADDDAGEAADEPPSDAPAMRGLDFLRRLHQNPPPVSTAGPPSSTGEKQPPARPPGTSGGEPESAPATVSVTEVGESSSAAARKKRRFAQTALPFGTPPQKPTPSPAPNKHPPRVSRVLTDDEKAEAKFDKALQLYITHWLPKFEWLLLDKNEDGLPVLRCSVCVEHGKDDARFGRNGPGGRDLQPGSMRCHELSVRHDDALRKQRTLMAEIETQKRLDVFANADKEGARLTRLMRAVDFICTHDAPIAMFPQLVQFMAEEGVEGIPLKSYGVYISQ